MAHSNRVMGRQLERGCLLRHVCQDTNKGYAPQGRQLWEPSYFLSEGTRGKGAGTRGEEGVIEDAIFQKQKPSSSRGSSQPYL